MKTEQQTDSRFQAYCECCRQWKYMDGFSWIVRRPTGYFGKCMDCYRSPPAQAQYKKPVETLF